MKALEVAKAISKRDQTHLAKAAKIYKEREGKPKMKALEDLIIAVRMSETPMTDQEYWNDEVIRLTETIRQALTQHEWQPIEKSPRDKNKDIWFIGSVLDSDGNIECADRCCWEYVEPRTEMIEVEDGVFIEEEFEPEEWNLLSNYGFFEEPTHFKPIKPPTQGEEE